MDLIRTTSYQKDPETDLDEALKHLSHVSALLHTDDAQMVLLVGPHQERFVLVVENTTADRPVAACVGSLQEPENKAEREYFWHY